MARKSTSRGQRIADSIRAILLNCDLRLVYAQGEIESARAEFEMHARLDSAFHQRKALTAKAKMGCYKTFMKNVNKTKKEVMDGLNHVLDRYSPKKKRIWIMYFIEQATTQEIANEMNYVSRNVEYIISEFRRDLEEYYND